MTTDNEFKNINNDSNYNLQHSSKHEYVAAFKNMFERELFRMISIPGLYKNNLFG